MNRVFSALIVTALAGLAGCSAKPYKYSDNYSEAHNLTRAAQMHSGIKDSPMPDNFDPTSSGVYNASYLATSTAIPMGGMSMAQGFGFGLASVLLDPKDHGARESMFGWMPLEGTPEEVQSKIMHEIRDAIIASIEELGGKPKVSYFNLERRILGISVEKEEWGCMPYSVVSEAFMRKEIKGKEIMEKLCSVIFALRVPSVSLTPDFLVGKHGLGEKSYSFPADERYNYSRLIVSNGRTGVDKKAGDARLPEHLLYERISSKMPETLYLYLPAKSVTIGDENNTALPYPQVLSKGETKLFFKP